MYLVIAVTKAVRIRRNTLNVLREYLKSRNELYTGVVFVFFFDIVKLHLEHKGK